MVTLVPVSASPPGPEVKCMYAIRQHHQIITCLHARFTTFYLTAVTVVRVPRMSCCCWSGVWTLNYTVWLKFCHFPNCKTVTRNWILFVTWLTLLLGGFIVLGLNRTWTWIHSNFLNIWTIANPVTVVRNHLQQSGPCIRLCAGVTITNPAWHVTHDTDHRDRNIRDTTTKTRTQQWTFQVKGLSILWIAPTWGA